MNEIKVELSQQTRFYVTMNKSFHIGFQVYVSRNNVNVPSETCLSENSYYVVTS